MDALRYVSLGLLFLVATMLGGAAVRLAVAAGDRRAAVSLALVAVLLAVGVARGVRTREALRNPYW